MRFQGISFSEVSFLRLARVLSVVHLIFIKLAIRPGHILSVEETLVCNGVDWQRVTDSCQLPMIA